MSIEDCKLLFAVGTAFSFIAPYFIQYVKDVRESLIKGRRSKKLLEKVFPLNFSQISDYVMVGKCITETFPAVVPEPEKGKKNIEENSTKVQDDVIRIGNYENTIQKYHQYLCKSKLQKSNKIIEGLSPEIIHLITFTFFVLNSAMFIGLITGMIAKHNNMAIDFLYIFVAFGVPAFSYFLVLVGGLFESHSMKKTWNNLKQQVKGTKDYEEIKNIIKNAIDEPYHNKMVEYVKKL